MIRIQNIYHMLSYAFQILKEQGYKDVATEDFKNTADLCGAILIRGIAVQRKRGLFKEYRQLKESRASPRGKMEISDSIKDGTISQKRIVCSFDELSINAYMNRIIKSTLLLLLRSDISRPRKKQIRKLTVYFQDVQTLDVHRINWNIQYNRNNQTYRMLIAICKLIIKGLLQTQKDGSTRLMDFLDEQKMCRLYEKFIFAYYKKEFPWLTVTSSQIPWQLDDNETEFLPTMQSDVILSYKEKTLIIDAKYYENILQINFDKQTIHSGNLYQIFTYVKNKQEQLKKQKHEVSGMLLYAGTDEEVQPDVTYRMSGNKISIKTLDLNKRFSTIAEKLNQIVGEYFGICAVASSPQP